MLLCYIGLLGQQITCSAVVHSMTVSSTQLSACEFAAQLVLVLAHAVCGYYEAYVFVSICYLICLQNYSGTY